MREIGIGVADALDDGDLPGLVAGGELGQVRVEPDGAVERDRRSVTASVGRKPGYAGSVIGTTRGEPVVAAAELDDDERAVVAPAERRAASGALAAVLVRRRVAVGPHRQAVARSDGRRRARRRAR